MAAKADKKTDAPSPDQTKADGPARKGLPVKLLGIVLSVMIAEGAAVYFVVSATGPKAAMADIQVADKDHGAHDEVIEVPLVDEKFQNMQSGRAYIWDTSIVIKIKPKDEPLVTTTLQRRAAEVKEGVSLIFRRAPHSQLVEPGLETINRQLHSYLNEVVGEDAEGKPRVQRVVIPKCKGFPAE